MAKPGGAAWIEEARAKAQNQFAQQKKEESAVWKEREKQRLADIDKMARLKTLRLAKEAADREAALTAPPKPVKPRAAAKPAKPKVKISRPGVVPSEED